MRKTLIAYVPVLHEGYIKLFRKWRGLDLLLIDEAMAAKYTDVNGKKEIRALDVEIIARCVQVLGYMSRIRIIGEDAPVLRGKANEIVMANDEICRKLAAEYFPKERVRFDDVFLRWDTAYVFSKNEIHYDRISRAKTDRELIHKAEKESKKTSDWWREVGAVIVKDGKIVMSAFNRHVPSEYAPYAFGDPRDIIKAGEQSELASAMHAEQVLIARAAEEGISLRGTDIYLTTFPCPLCAKLIAFSGIRRCFIKGGHASLDGEHVLRARRVEIILVK